MSKVYPVIHTVSVPQAARNIEHAITAGADGVFLINHDIDVMDLNVILRRMRVAFPDLWLGVNYLGGPEHLLPLMATHANGLWMDGIPRNRLNLDIPVLGGVGFKYRHSDLTLALEVAGADPLVDVLVTSGTATGQPTPLAKVQEIRGLVPDKPLGIALGLTPDNVRDYRPWADWLLVATGVSLNHLELDLGLLQAFVQAVRA